jgi:hypothetical protein
VSLKRQSGRVVAVIAATATCSLGFAVSADAATTVTITGSTPSNLLIIGEADADLITIAGDATTVRVTDTGPGGISPGPACAAVDATTVTCPVDPPGPAFGPIATYGGTLGGGDDVLTVARDLNGVVAGEAGADAIIGGPGDDNFDGGPGNDTIIGGPGSDVLTADAGNDAAAGGEGSDSINSGDGTDTLNGDAGNDDLSDGRATSLTSLAIGSEPDVLDGGPGDDVASYSREVPLNLSLDGVANDGEPGEGDNLVAIEGLTGGEAGDVLTGNDGPNFISGHQGNDTINGLGGTDLVRGNDGDDLLAGGAGADDVVCDDGIDIALIEPLDDVDALCERTGVRVADLGTVGISSKGKAKVAIECPAEEAAPCVGTLSLLDGARQLGSGQFEIAPGSTSLVTTKLSKQGAKRLAKSGGMLLVTARAETTEPGGSSIDEGQALIEGRVKQRRKGGKGGHGPKSVEGLGR